MSFSSSTLFGLLSVVVLSSSAAAATLSEGSGNFSNDWTAPTFVDGGTTNLSGTGAPEWMGGDRFDVFHITGLAPGASSILIDFSLTGPVNPNRYANGGGSIYISDQLFSGSYYVDQGNGSVLGSNDLLAGAFDVTYNPWDPNNPASQGHSTFELALDESFGGSLYLAMDFTYGAVTYDITLPSLSSPGDAFNPGPSPSPVPLPAGAWLMLSGLSGLGLVSWRRRRRQKSS